MADEKGPIVFVGDEDDAVRNSLKLLLQVHGFEVADFASIAELSGAANANAAVDRPACIVLDLNLPGMSGLDYLAESAAHWAKLPVIMTTGRGDPISRARAERLGALAFFDKPVNNDLLVAAIHRALAAS